MIESDVSSEHDLSVDWRCPKCEKPGTHEFASGRTLACGHCDHSVSLAERSLGPDSEILNPLPYCSVCDYDRMFAQKDFNRKIGLVIVVIGAVLSPWTYGMSLLVCMGLDYGLYRFVPEITVCYGCDAIHRGFAHNPLHRAHDPLLADRYKRQSPPWLDSDERDPELDADNEEGAAATP